MRAVFVHVAKRAPDARIWTKAFRRALEEMGELRLVEGGERISQEDLLACLRSADVVLTGWGAQALPEDLAVERGRVRYVCHLTGTMKGLVPVEIVRRGIPVTNWGDAPASGIAEAAITLLLASLKNLRGHIECGGLLEPPPWAWSGTLQGLSVGVYGMGRIGRRFCEMARPFGCRLSAFDPHASEWPDGVERRGSLRELFGAAHAVVIHAGLTEDTRGSVTGDLLRLLPDGGIVVNTARGDIVEQEALFAELRSGRLRAALDVLAGPDWLPPEHLAHRWPNLLLTHHKAGANHWPWAPDSPDAPLQSLHRVCLENVAAFLRGHALRFVVDERVYALSS